MGALIYLVAVSFRNRLVSRVKRLRQPKYLVGAVVGGAYFYFYFFRFLVRRPSAEGLSGATWLTPENMPLVETLAGLAFAIVVLLGWLLPHSRAALTFTEAEIAFLFPAPVKRRTLIQFKLLRSQLAILFTVLVFTFVFRRGGAHVWMTAVGWWLIFSTLNLHFLAASFLRTMLLDRGITNWTRRLVILAFVIVVTGAVGLWARTSLPVMQPIDWARPAEWLKQWRGAVEAGPLPIALYPFRLMVRPYLASQAREFLVSALPALGILAVHYLWVIRANIAFEEASLEASRKLARRIEAVKAGRQGAGQPTGARRDPFVLRPDGPVEVAFLWKNLLGAGGHFNARLFIGLSVALGVLVVGLLRSSQPGGWVGIVGMVAVILLAWSLLLGPQVVMQDLRQDLRMADHLKVYPLRGWRIVLGQLLAPSMILTLVQWLLIPIAVAGLVRLDAQTRDAAGIIISIGVAAAIVAPSLNLLGLVIPNAAVLLLPAWFLTDKTAPAGIETTGQRIVMFLGQFLVLLVGALPAAVVFTSVLLVVKWMAGWWLAAPLAGLAAAVVLLAEVGVAVAIMGRWFEKLDVSAESPA